MSRSPRQTAAFSLFTFLDVMLCTLGALIIVLICVVRTAQIKNADEAPETSAEIEEITSQRETVEWRAKHLAASREKARAQLQDRRLELSHVEEHSRRLRMQVAELEAAEAALTSERRHDEKLDRLRGEAQRLASLAADAERDLDETRRQAQSKRPSYAVIPYEGPSQTLRRPMYIECVADRIILQPENIEFSSQDFLGPLGPGNPLAVGLRAAREFLLKYQSTSAGEPGEPYPLLLVRPDGVEAYYAAREAMSSWGSEFGYEFIDQDWKLDFREPQPAMVDAIRLAVDEARLRQRALARAAPRLKGEKHASGWYRASPHGGVVQDGAPSSDDDGPSGGWSGRRGRSGNRGGYAQSGGSGQNGWGQNGAGASGSNRYAGSGGSGSDRYAGGRSGGGAAGTDANGTTAASDDDLASIYGAAAGGGTGYAPAGAGTGAGTGGAMSGGAAGGPAAIPGMGNGAGASMLGSSNAPGAGDSFLASNSGDMTSGGLGSASGAGNGTGAGDGPLLTPGGFPPGGGSFAPGATAAGQQPGGGAGNQLTGGLPAGAGGGGAAGDMTGGAVASGAGSNGRAGGGWNQQQSGGTAAINGATASSSSGAGGGGNGQGQPGANAGQMAGGGAANMPGAAQIAGSAAANGQGGGAGAGQAGGQQGQQGAGMIGKGLGGPAGQSGNPGGQAGMMSGASSANSAQSAQAGGSAGSSSPGMQQGMPNLNMQYGQQQTASSSMADSRGKNWSLPEEARHAVPISRPVRLECRADKLILRSEQNPSQTKEIPLTERTEDSVEDLVASVWQRVETWGSAGRGMFWRPVLSVEVAPGADGRYADLQTLLADSGLEVKPAAKPPAQAARPKRKIVPW